MLAASAHTTSLSSDGHRHRRGRRAGGARLPGLGDHPSAGARAPLDHLPAPRHGRGRLPLVRHLGRIHRLGQNRALRDARRGPIEGRRQGRARADPRVPAAPDRRGRPSKIRGAAACLSVRLQRDDARPRQTASSMRPRRRRSRKGRPMNPPSRTDTNKETAPSGALEVTRFFTSPDRASVRHRRVGAARRAHRPRRPGGVRAEGRRVPDRLVAECDQHRRPEVLPRTDRPPRARALGQADGRPRRRHHRRLGPRARLLRKTDEDAEAFEPS
jgi:hypothetical protein